MFIKRVDEESGEIIYVNSNEITEIFSYDGEWFMRTTNKDEYEIDEETKNLLVGESKPRRRKRDKPEEGKKEENE